MKKRTKTKALLLSVALIAAIAMSLQSEFRTDTKSSLLLIENIEALSSMDDGGSGGCVPIDGWCQRSNGTTYEAIKGESLQ